MNSKVKDTSGKKGISAFIVDAAGNTVPRGEPGELCTRGYSVMLGYWADPEKTAEAVDGWQSWSRLRHRSWR